MTAVKRNIHFYRAVVPLPGDRLAAFDPGPILKHIDALPFAAGGRYYDDGQRVLCVWVDKVEVPARLRLAVVRRQDLPSVEEGGELKALELSEDAGLVEQIHVVFFDHAIVGCDFNFYGPRLPGLARYLRNRGGDGAPMVTFDPLVRRDVADLLEQYEGVRLLDLRIRRSEIDEISKIDRTLGEAFGVQARVGDAEELELVLKLGPYARKGSLGSSAFNW